MKRNAKVAIICVVLAIALAFFFFAPVIYWTNVTPPVPPVYRTFGLVKTVPIYRSLGCAVVGYGDLYSPGGVILNDRFYSSFGFSFGCKIPFPVYL